MSEKTLYFRKQGETTLLPVTPELTARARKRGDLVLVYEDGSPAGPVPAEKPPMPIAMNQATTEDFARQFSRQPAPTTPAALQAPAEVTIDNRSQVPSAPNPEAGVVVTGEVAHRPQPPETIPTTAPKPPIIAWTEIEAANIKAMKKPEVIDFAKAAFDLELSPDDSIQILKKRLTAHINIHRPKAPAAPPAE